MGCSSRRAFHEGDLETALLLATGLLELLKSPLPQMQTSCYWLVISVLRKLKLVCCGFQDSLGHIVKSHLKKYFLN